MARGRHSAKRQRRGALWRSIGAVLLATGLGLAFVGLRGHQVALRGPVSTATLPVRTPTHNYLSDTRSTPVRLIIPALKISVRLITLGLNANGTVQVPSTTTTAGWYRFGPAPGQIGSAVILGHVDSYLGEGIFFFLRTLRAGQRIYVDLANGRTVQFKITAVTMYAKTAFPPRKVYGSHGYSALQLVTCGGIFNRTTRSYESNIVVYSERI